MAKSEIEFLEYFTQAQLEALDSRESKIVELRYGLNDGNALTLAAIGEFFGVSRERVRQILDKAHKKIIFQGQREIKANSINNACAKLLLYIRSIIHPQDANSVERIIDFYQISLAYLPQKTHGIPLLCYLAYSNKNERKERLSEAKKKLRELALKQKKLVLEQEKIAKFSELLSYAVYPKDIKRIERSDFSLFRRQRNVSNHSEGISGSIYSFKLNREVQYESGLERDFILGLESFDNVIFYQEQPLKIFYKINGDDYYYYPDFLFVLKNGKAIVVEIKPVFQMALKKNLIKWSALKVYCQRQGWGLLVTDGRYPIQQVQRHQIKRDFEDLVLNELHRKSLNWVEYKKIKDKFNPSSSDFVALVLKNRLAWQLSPFYLSF